MQSVSREQLKKLFKKVKKLHLPPELEQIPFSDLTYYSWPDESSQSLYLLYDYKGQTAGIKLDFLKPGSGPKRLGFCEFCLKGKKGHEVLFVSAETRRRPKHVNYQVRGTWICQDYVECNKKMKNPDKVEDFFYRILDKA